mgnify:CR=1 FL=1
MVDEVLVESWKVCCGWVEEFCINSQDHMDGYDFGVGVFVKSDDGGYIDEPFGMRPMCNYHLSNGGFPHPSGGGVSLTRQTWELLVQMCGYLTEEGERSVLKRIQSNQLLSHFGLLIAGVMVILRHRERFWSMPNMLQ